MTKRAAPATRFREALLLVARESEQDPHFGAIKLNKILFFSDMIAFGTTGETITGQEYVRKRFGPVPRRMKPVRDRHLAP